MSGWTKYLTLALLAPACMAAAMAPRERPESKSHSIAKPAISEIPAISLVIARYPDGGYITDVNFDRKPPVLRPEMLVVINGKGFGERTKQSLAGLFDGPATTGMELDIRKWTDTQIAVMVPSSQSRYFPTTDQARLSLQVVKNGILISYDLRNMRFVAEA